jgi:hypothetical protein
MDDRAHPQETVTTRSESLAKLPTECQISNCRATTVYNVYARHLYERRVRSETEVGPIYENRMSPK